MSFACTAVVSIFGNFRLLCIYLTSFNMSTSAYAGISQRALSNKACMYVHTAV